ncbi:MULTISPECIES: phage tail tape measure protein [unclassified Comamonas]|uniref:phage tail tape measure protein n=1 Tax=unclassified Comamonas TaxID=2638500 RepID=UPI001FA6AE2A|nr:MULTISPECIES: phage tail tape measure protein [unclassified Comamonas]UNV89519.1 phage tail tape measure protein [Comamonas sp. 7D-2evo1]UNV97182.1 phage tail tape measure protein [Comamonas sp. 7D-2]UNV99164.1 phage tail tape measure protein [Comamonas sp. 7D-2evo2]
MAFKPIQIVINAKDDASAVLSRLGRNVKLLGATVAGYFGIKAFAGVVQSAADFEAAMSRVKAATEGSAAEMAELTKAAQAAGSNTKYTSVQAAGALENLAKAGLSAGDSVKALPAVLALAQAGDIELGKSSEYVTKAVMGMGLAFNDAGRVADVLAKGANATNTSVEGLAQALSYAAPVANTLGVSLESTVAIIGKFADAGIDASRAGTALNSIMSQFANPLSSFRKELGAAGIVTTNFEEALHQLAAKGQDGERAINAVGLEAGPALRALLNQGMGALDELTGKLREAGGSAEATAKTMADNLNGSLKGLSSMWETVTQVLGKPVLPVVRKGVDELTGALRKAVDNGLVERFGQALATAFENGLKFFRAFAANVNFDAVVLRLQVFASEAGETLQRIGQYATNAGNTVQLAWGVMTAGVNGVLTAIYGLGAAFAQIASKVMEGVAQLRSGLASVTFGGLSESFRLAAADAEEMAGAFAASADALKAKAAESLQGMADGAQTARDAWDGLTGTVEAAGKSAEAAAPAIEAVAAGIEATGKAAAKAARDTAAKAEADRIAAENLRQLKVEYQQLIASGNLDAAGRKLQEIAKAQRAAAGTAEDAAKSTALLEQAYKDLGMTTNEDLQRMATQARAAFDQLEKDGQQPPMRIAEAWKAMADKVIAANGGIAPEWLKTQAAVKGYVVELDEAGKAIVNTDRATRRATASMTTGFNDLTKSVRGAGKELERFNDRHGDDRPGGYGTGGGSIRNKSFEELLGRPPTADERQALGNGLTPMDVLAGGSLAVRNANIKGSPSVMQQNTGPLSLVPQFQTRQELDAWWKQWQTQYAQDNPFTVKSSGALGNYQYDLTQFAVTQAGRAIDLQQAAANARPKRETERKPSTPSPAPQAPTAVPAPTPSQSVITHRHEVVIGGRQYNVGTDAAGSSEMQQLMAALERDANLTGGVH